MGGTSTDVAHYDGDYERAFDTEVAGVRIRAPMMRIHTVAAGGGSILHFEAGRFRAGPDSAGANPGPACYRRGGPLAVTDANVMLGKLQPDFFPAIFGPGQDQPLDAEIVHEKFEALAAEIGDGRSPEAVAEGFVTIAVENMANAIKKISVQRGYDVTEYLLNCFGGAGGQHACLVADALGMEAVLIHPFSGLLSAYGIGLSGVFASRQQALLQAARAKAQPARSKSMIATLRAAVLEELAGPGHCRKRAALQAGAADPLRRHRHRPAGRLRARLDRPAQGRISRRRTRRSSASSTTDKPMIVEAVGVEGADATRPRPQRARFSARGNRRNAFRDQRKSSPTAPGATPASSAARR